MGVWKLHNYLSFAIRLSSSLACTLLFNKSRLIFFNHALFLWYGRNSLNLIVLRSQPKSAFVCDNYPSPSTFSFEGYSISWNKSPLVHWSEYSKYYLTEIWSWELSVCILISDFSFLCASWMRQNYFRILTV